VNDDNRSRDGLAAEVATLRRRLAALEAAPEIFVSIASYCDADLPRTLDDCIANATHPDKLRFGICWQYDTDNPVDLTGPKKDKRIQFAEYSYQDSQGGTWARSIAQRFWNGEPYTLQIDSHMKFEPAWDTRLVEMINRLPSEKPLITVNCPLFWFDDRGTLHREVEKGVPTSSLGDWSEAWGWAPWIVWGVTNSQFPGRNRFISGAFVFTLGQWNTEVPQDPQHYYWGEEFNLTVRSFCHGYDLFLPEEIVVWHRSFEQAPRRHWEHGEDVIQEKNRIAFERLRMLIYSDDKDEQRQLAPYVLGDVRSKHDYEVYAGFDFARKTAHPDVLTGRNPDPVTIKSARDWERCRTFKEHQHIKAVVAEAERLQASATAGESSNSR